MIALFRSVALTAALATLALLPAPAPAANLHNGVIVIRNDTHARMRIGGLYDLPAFYIYPGQKFETTSCCFAAGTHYTINYIGSGEQYYHHYTIVPKLCNTNGIPYGYADIAIELKSGKYEVVRLDGDTCYPA